MKDAEDLTWLHRSRHKHPELRPLSYDELTKDRTHGSWTPEQTAAYVRERKLFEAILHRRLAAKGIPSDRGNTFLYATLADREKMENKPGGFEHRAPLSADLVNSSFFDVVGDGKSRTVLGPKGLAAALKRWEAAKDNLETSEYMGMKINPRIEVITPSTVTPDSITKAARAPSKGCLMAILPESVAKRIQAWGKASVPAEDLAEDGLETESHATALYGFDNSVAPGDIKLPDRPIEMTLGKVKRFKADDNRPGSDVLVLEVTSSDLKDLNARLKKEHDVTSTYKTFNAHVTIAYVKPGALPGLDGSDTFDGDTCNSNTLVLSRTVDGKRVKDTMNLSTKSASMSSLPDLAAGIIRTTRPGLLVREAALERARCQGYLEAHLKRASSPLFSPTQVPGDFFPEADEIHADDKEQPGGRMGSIIQMLLGLLGGGGGGSMWDPPASAEPPPPPRGALESIFGGPPGGKLIPQPEAEAAVAKMDAADKARPQPVAGPMGGNEDEPVGISGAAAASKPVTGPPAPPPQPAPSGAMGGGGDDPVGLRGVGINFDDEKTNLARGKWVGESLGGLYGPTWAGSLAGSGIELAGDAWANRGVGPGQPRKALIKPIEEIENVDDTPLPGETREGNSAMDTFWKYKYNPLTPVLRSTANVLGNGRIAAQNAFKDPFSDEDFGAREAPAPRKLRPPPKPPKPPTVAQTPNRLW